MPTDYDYSSLSPGEYLYLSQVKHLVEESDRALGRITALQCSLPWDDAQAGEARRMTELVTAAALLIRESYAVPNSRLSAYHHKMVELLTKYSESAAQACLGGVRLDAAREAGSDLRDLADDSSALLSELIGPRADDTAKEAG